MRLLVVSACVAVIATAPALASPRRLLCVLHPDAIATTFDRGAPVERVPRVRLAVPDAHHVRLAARPRLAAFTSVRTHGDRDRDMPWIWRVLRERAFARLPRHDAEGFSLVLSPVVVSSPTDSIPGVGVAGSF